jgi:hypothetical protein
MIYKGNLRITKENQDDFKNLIKVTRYLRVCACAKLDAPKLESVGADVCVYEGSELDAPKLETVGGNVCAYGDTLSL